MASPLKAGKQPVSLAGGGGVRVSKIRRDPPPVAKKVTIADRDERDRKMAAIGIGAFTLAILLIIAGIATYNGWSPSQTVVEIRMQ